VPGLGADRLRPRELTKEVEKGRLYVLGEGRKV
jgi:hypothetical protein